MDISRSLVIRKRIIEDDADCFVIAEIGHNHQGEMSKAVEMFRTAKECGVDAVKLQKRDNKSLYTKAMYDSPYDNPNSYGSTYGEHREAVEFGMSEYMELKALAEELDIAFMSTAFDLKSVEFLEKVGIDAYKCASGDLKSTPLLKEIASTGRPMVLSTGGGTLEDVDRAHDAIAPITDKFAILQCTAAYPAEAQHLNLRVIPAFRDRYSSIVIGLSDHQNGIAMAPVAYVLGARIIEKHFTLNRALKGTDHSFSLEPNGLSKMIRDLQRTRLALGIETKTTHPLEEKPLLKMGKQLVASRQLEAGRLLTADDIAMKSPGGGLPPFEMHLLLGATLMKPLSEDEPFTLDIVRA